MPVDSRKDIPVMAYAEDLATAEQHWYDTMAAITSDTPVSVACGIKWNARENMKRESKDAYKADRAGWEAYMLENYPSVGVV